MKIALIGNYAPDRQQSMIRYANMLQGCLADAGQDVNLVAPRKTLPWVSDTGPGRWLGYLDKYLLGVADLLHARKSADIVHVCDHSNSIYIPRHADVPYTITCHDLLAVRGARGEIEDCAASHVGKFLQRAILAGLARARGVVCVSAATAADFRRLAPEFAGEVLVVPNALNFEYRPLDSAERGNSMGPGFSIPEGMPFLLHVGSNSRRKNRDMLIRALAELGGRWNGCVVLAGEPLSVQESQLASSLGVAGRVIQIVEPGNEQLRQLYNRALCLLFPSRWEGFGWPLIEAQACGCPVLCSDRPPMPEVTGGAALYCPPDDAAAFAHGVVTLSSNSQIRGALVAKGLENAQRFTTAAMTAAMTRFFESVVHGARAGAP